MMVMGEIAAGNCYLEAANPVGGHSAEVGGGQIAVSRILD